MSKTRKQRIGDLGEDLAEMFLTKHKFRILDRNYRKKFGEIDIIAKRCKILHFVEVKTVSREMFSRETKNEKVGTATLTQKQGFFGKLTSVFRKDVSCENISEEKMFSHETNDSNYYEPEDNVHEWKMMRINRAIEAYLNEKHIPDDQEYQIDLVAVYVDAKNKKSRVKYIPNI